MEALAAAEQTRLVLAEAALLVKATTAEVGLGGLPTHTAAAAAVLEQWVAMAVDSVLPATEAMD